MSLKTFAASAGLVFVLFLGVAAGAAEYEILLKTSPKLELLRPFADPVNLSLLVTHADGRPATHGRVAIVVDAPEPGMFLSTDYPLVEGTRLLELDLPLRRGRAEWKYLFPIRGNYRLSVNFVATDGQTMTREFVITVRENREKWQWLGLFCAGLLVVGFIAGRIFTTPARAARVTLLLLAIVGVAGVTGHDGPSATANVSDPPSPLELDAAVVGAPAGLRWRPSAEAPDKQQLSLTITHVEKRKTMFAIDRVPVAGEFGVKFHYPDGAEYRVNAVAEAPGREPVRAERLVAVTGVEPAVSAQLPALLFFLSLLALGLGAGRYSAVLRHHS